MTDASTGNVMWELSRHGEESVYVTGPIDRVLALRAKHFPRWDVRSIVTDDVDELMRDHDTEELDDLSEYFGVVATYDTQGRPRVTNAAGVSRPFTEADLPDLGDYDASDGSSDPAPSCGPAEFASS